MALVTISLEIFLACLTVCQCLTETVKETPKCLLDTPKVVDFRRSWLAIENGIDLDDQDNEIVLNGTKDTELKLCNETLKGPMVSQTMAEYCTLLPHNGRLDDGTIYHYNFTGDCFVKLDNTKFPWGISDFDGTPLNVYSSAAAADIPLGTTLLVQELINIKIPDSKQLHNGCIRIDHICNTCQLGCQKIRLFVGTYQNLKVFPKFDKATVQKSNCTILKYD